MQKGSVSMQKEGRMRPTLQTVADAVGVSRSTVSNAYSRPDQLSPELRRRILDAAVSVGYAGPDPTARSLRRGRAGAVGVLFTSSLPYAFTDPYAVQFLRGLAESVHGKETGLLLVPQSQDDEQAAVSAVENAAVDGFCVFCLPDWHPSWAAIQSRGLPVVSAQRRPADSPETFFVGIDEAAATRAAGEHLVHLGHRRVAIIGDHLLAGPTRPVTLHTPDDVGYYGSRERLRGYYDAFREAGVDWSGVTTISTAVNSKEAGTTAAAYLLDRADPPTALVAFSDILALGILDALAARGLRAGHDVSVIGFDDIPEAADAALTTIRQPAAERGRLSGRLLLDPPEEPTGRQIVLPTELVVRDSTRTATKE
jgi:DNA-binding LacI/PurR family transcriptional regulator